MPLFEENVAGRPLKPIDRYRRPSSCNPVEAKLYELVTSKSEEGL
jgi:hypothetical protein